MHIKYEGDGIEAFSLINLVLSQKINNRNIEKKLGQ